MITITHKVTRKSRIVTQAQLDAILANPMTKVLFDVKQPAEVPEEVKELMAQKSLTEGIELPPAKSEPNQPDLTFEPEPNTTNKPGRRSREK